MEGGEWKVEVEVGCPPWASVHADSQESLPDRIAYDHPEENTALLPVPASAME